MLIFSNFLFNINNQVLSDIHFQDDKYLPDDQEADSSDEGS